MLIATDNHCITSISFNLTASKLCIWNESNMCSNKINDLFLFLCRGYLSPEYGSFGHVSTKIDVYSFGVLVLEVISGRRCIDSSKPPDEQILSDWVCIIHATKALNDVFFFRYTINKQWRYNVVYQYDGNLSYQPPISPFSRYCIYPTM